MKTRITSQWSGGGNSDFVIHVVFLPQTARVAVSASLISAVMRLRLPLILRDADVKEVGIPFLDTTQIHVKAIIAQLLS